MTPGADSELATPSAARLWLLWSVAPSPISLAFSQPRAGPGSHPLAVHREQVPEATALFWGLGHLSSRVVGGPG